jgi:hypothetical protein
MHWEPKVTIENTLKVRGQQYGDFRENTTIMQSLKRLMRNTRNWDQLADDQAEALDMIAHKIGRILGGNPDHKDSWHDIAGYAKLIDDRLPDPNATCAKDPAR